MEQIKFQYYKNDVTSSKPSGFITLDQMLSSIKNPRSEMKRLLKKIEIASENKDNKLKSELKKGLYAFTPAVIVKDRRKYDNITEYTGLAVLDFDKINNCIKFKEYLFNEYKSIIACWLSPSKKGVKALVRIPKVKSKIEFKSYSWGLSAEMEIYKGFDIAVNNAVLLMFIGMDPNILIRDNATEWIRKGIQKNSFDISKVKEFKPQNKITDKQSQWVIDWFSRKINDIYDNGHPQVRDNSVTLGGYVGSGYLSEFDAINLVESLISKNSYLQKGIYGYQKTARDMIKVGQTKPLTFN